MDMRQAQVSWPLATPRAKYLHRISSHAKSDCNTSTSVDAYMTQHFAIHSCHCKPESSVDRTPGLVSV
jgi:hypothetical protein